MNTVKNVKTGKPDKTVNTQRNFMQKAIFKICFLGMMAAGSVILAFLIHFPMFLPFLEYDAADITIFFTTILFGPYYGLILTVVVSIVQGLTVSVSGGIIGVIMHIVATGSFVLVAGLCLYPPKKKEVNGEIKMKEQPNMFRIIISFVFGIITMTVIMCLWNLILTPLYMKTTISEVLPIILPAILPFNLLKATVNGMVAVILYQMVRKTRIINRFMI